MSLIENDDAIKMLGVFEYMRNSIDMMDIFTKYIRYLKNIDLKLYNEVINMIVKLNLHSDSETYSESDLLIMKKIYDISKQIKSDITSMISTNNRLR